MNESLKPQHSERISRKVESGLYSSSEAVLDRALDLLDDYDAELADIREKVRVAKEQAKNGQYKDYTDETLHELFESISERGRR